LSNATNPESRHKRKESFTPETPEGHWRKYTYEEIVARDKPTSTSSGSKIKALPILIIFLIRIYWPGRSSKTSKPGWQAFRRFLGCWEGVSIFIATNMSSLWDLSFLLRS